MPISEQRAQELAEEIEHDEIAFGESIPRDEWPEPLRSGRGRPSIGGDRGASPQVTIRITPEMRKRLDQRAAAEGTTVSKLARRAIEVLLEDA